jgi:hypothetical protein
VICQTFYITGFLLVATSMTSIPSSPGFHPIVVVKQVWITFALRLAPVRDGDGIGRHTDEVPVVAHEEDHYDDED